MNSTVSPSCYFGTRHRGVVTAWPTWPAYVDGQKVKIALSKVDYSVCNRPLSTTLCVIDRCGKFLCKGFCKEKNIPKIRDYYGSGWVGPGLQVSLGIFVCGKSSQNIPKPVLIFWSRSSVFFLHC